MGRPKGGTNRSHSKEEKLTLVKRNLAGENLLKLEREGGICNSQIHKWTKQYLEGGEEVPVNKRKPDEYFSRDGYIKSIGRIYYMEQERPMLECEGVYYSLTDEQYVELNRRISRFVESTD